jgi:hypothetical protein
MKNKMIIPVVITAVIALGAGFFGGMKYQQTKTPSFNRMANGGRGGNFGNGANGGMMNIRPVNGDVISSDDKSLTVKMADGSSKIVLISATTTITKSQAGAKADIQANGKVSVFGQQNSDGSVTAQSIQIR